MTECSYSSADPYYSSRCVYDLLLAIGARKDHLVSNIVLFLAERGEWRG